MAAHSANVRARQWSADRVRRGNDLGRAGDGMPPASTCIDDHDPRNRHTPADLIMVTSHRLP